VNPCERCGRLAVDGGTDFGIGGSQNAFVLDPTCFGVAVKVGGRVLGYVAAAELQSFLDRAYGAPGERRAE
jgi:hypothetical protein